MCNRGGIMSHKFIPVLLTILSILPIANAQDVNFDGNTRKSSDEMLDMRGAQNLGKGTVEVFLDDDGFVPAIPTKDRSGIEHYKFTPGKTRAKIHYRCNDAPIDQPPWQVKITLPVSHPEVAGHDHASSSVLNRQVYTAKTISTPRAPEPAIKYSWLVNEAPWAPPATPGDTVISPQLSANSVFSLIVNIPQYATQMVTHVEFIGCRGGEVDYLDIMMPGLTELPQSSLYISTGSNKLHQFNHYATTTTVAALVDLATQWNLQHPGANRLVFNDMSLKWGGRFDVLGNWRGSHSNHSFGFATDVSKKCVKKSNRGALILLMDNLGFGVWSEGERFREQNHYHIQHQKELDRLRTLNFPIELDGRMKGDTEFEDDTYDNNGGGIPINPPPIPSRMVTGCVALMKKYYPNPPFNCNEAFKPDGTPGAGITQPYCQCINLYTVTGTPATPDVKLIAEKDIEPIGCAPQSSH